jgi:YD repeat-containing protein
LTGGVGEKRFFNGATLKRREVYGYSGRFGDLTSVTTYNPAGVALRREAYAIEESTGRLLAKMSPEGRIEYFYDNQGNLTTLRTGTGEETEYGYGKYGRLLRVTVRRAGQAERVDGTSTMRSGEKRG